MKRYMLFGVYGVLGLLVLGAIAFKVFQPVQVVPRIRLAPGFSLTTQDGDIVADDVRTGVIISHRQTNSVDPVVVECERRMLLGAGIQTAKVPAPARDSVRIAGRLVGKAYC